MENIKDEKNEKHISEVKGKSIPKKENRPKKTIAKETKTKTKTTKPITSKKEISDVKETIKTKKPTTTKKSSTKKSTVKTKTPKKIEKRNEKNRSLEKSLLIETVENIETGAKVVGEKASEIAGGIFDTVKKSVSTAFDVSSKFVAGIYKTAGEYTEIYKEKAEMKKLNEKKNYLLTKLGSTIYIEKVEKKISTEKIFDDSDLNALLKKIEKIDTDIINLGKDLDKQ